MFNYLNYNRTNAIDVDVILEDAKKNNESKKIDLGYFLCTFYLKGTCHIEFKDMDLLEKFNIFGSQKKKLVTTALWKKPYSGFSEREKEVIKEFNGEKAIQ